jgi:hypothetical protein
MFITCLDFKINEKILCLKFPLVSDNNILIPYYMSSNLEKLSLFFDFKNSIELEEGWFVLPINKPIDEVKDFLKVFDVINKENLTSEFKDFLHYLEGTYYLDLEKTVLFVLEYFNEEYLKIFTHFLNLKNEDIYALLKLKETQKEMGLPYVVYHTKDFTLVLGEITNNHYISIRFNKMSDYISFINKINKTKIN